LAGRTRRAASQRMRQRFERRAVGGHIANPIGRMARCGVDEGAGQRRLNAVLQARPGQRAVDGGAGHVVDGRLGQVGAQVGRLRRDVGKRLPANRQRVGQSVQSPGGGHAHQQVLQAVFAAQIAQDFADIAAVVDQAHTGAGRQARKAGVERRASGGQAACTGGQRDTAQRRGGFDFCVRSA
jgi:hypothetical protein